MVSKAMIFSVGYRGGCLPGGRWAIPTPNKLTSIILGVDTVLLSCRSAPSGWLFKRVVPKGVTTRLV